MVPRDIRSLGILWLLLILFGIAFMIINIMLLIIPLAIMGIQIPATDNYVLSMPLLLGGIFCIIALLGLIPFGKFVKSKYLSLGAIITALAMMGVMIEIYRMQSLSGNMIISYLPAVLSIYGFGITLLVYGFVELFEITGKYGFLIGALLFMFVSPLACGIIGLSFIEISKELSIVSKEYLEKLRREIETIKLSIPGITRKQLAARLGITEFIVMLAEQW